MSAENYREHILGGTILQVEVDAESNLPTFILDNGTHFQMSAEVSGADYDEYASFDIIREGHNQRTGGYVGFDGASEVVSLDGPEKSIGEILVEDLYGAEAFQQFVGCVITRVALTSGVSIELDNRLHVSSGCYDYLNNNRYQYKLRSLVD